MKHIIILTRHVAFDYETTHLVSTFISNGFSVRVCQFEHFNIIINKPMKYRNEDFQLPDVVLVRLGASITFTELSVVHQFELLGIRCVNTSTSIDIVQNKFRTSQLLSSNNIAVPTTTLVKFPADINVLSSSIGFPCIVKVLVGSFGEGVYMIKTASEYAKFVEFLKNVNNKERLLVQEYVGDQPGADLRVFVVGNKVIGAMKRTAPPNDFRANITIGGTGELYQLTDEIREIALATTKTLGLEIAGVDLLFDQNGFKVCEANSNPGFKGFDHYCKTYIATEIVNYIDSLII